MRSAREIRFRVGQQIDNVRLLVGSPSLPRGAQIADVSFPDWLGAAEPVEEIAEQILRHRFPLLGGTTCTGPDIEWRRDYVHGRVTGLSWFRLIPYLDFEKTGDHKNIWELNRHQHLVLLAHAFVLTGRDEYMAEIARQLESWWVQNPFLKGINWASALEVAFRALSWLWLDHLAGAALGQHLRERLWNSLYQHGRYLEHNLSTYFSPNTHLLGEGVALFALGLKFPFTAWKTAGKRVVEEELARQVRGDGSHFEQSTYYHVYALDFFLLYYVLAGRPPALLPTLRNMRQFLAAVNGPRGPLSFLGDDDGGRLFHPYGNRAQFGSSTLQLCEKELGITDQTPEAAVFFPDCGLAAISRGDLHILIDAGPFGPGGAGHTHSDTLSLVVRNGREEILIDPGTYTYVADAKLRDAFRGSAYHNTIRVDGLDQGDPVKPFRWDNKPAVRVRRWDVSAERVLLDAECTSRGITHRRRWLLLGSTLLFILDEVTGAPGEHLIEQFWHAGAEVSEVTARSARIGTTAVLFAAPEPPDLQTGWRSRVLGRKDAAPVIVLGWKGTLPQVCATAFVFSGAFPAGGLQLARGVAWIELRLGDTREGFEA